jgi:hypothetical protein
MHALTPQSLSQKLAHCMLLLSGTGSHEFADGEKPPLCCTIGVAKKIALILPATGSYLSYRPDSAADRGK